MIWGLWSIALLAVFGTVVQQTDANLPYIAEVYFVVEPQVLRNYINLGYSPEEAETNLRGDIRFFLHQVNRYFQSMERLNLSMEVRSKELLIMTDDMFDQSQIENDRYLSAPAAKDFFKEWLRSRQAIDIVQYDAAILWTGYDIKGSTGSRTTTGYANSRSACKRVTNVAVVEFDGTQATAHTTSHELAHMLGSTHDDEANCPSFSGHVMSAQLKMTNRRRWSFSECTVNSIKNYIAYLDRSRWVNCFLHTSSEADTSFRMESQRDRDIMDVENICKREKNNPTSYFCGYHRFYDGDEPKGDLACRYLYCALGGSRTCGTAMPTEGMICDVEKRCNQGRCLPAPSDFSVPDTVQHDCVFGDVKSGIVLRERGTCDDYLDNKGLNQCYRYLLRRECCATCERRKLTIQGCPYGDHYSDCTKYTAEEICPNNSEECCQLCSGFRGKRSSGDDGVGALPKLFMGKNDDSDDENEDYEEPIEEDE